MRTFVYVDAFNLYYGCLKRTPWRWLNIQKLCELLLPKVAAPGQALQHVEVIKTEEKGSDVNLATHLLNDAHHNRFDVAVVISNDSDLQAPIKIVRTDMGKKVGVLNPQKNPSRAILPHIDFFKLIRPGVLGLAQFPEQLSDQHGSFTKPGTW